jgi:TolB protein
VRYLLPGLALAVFVALIVGLPQKSSRAAWPGGNGKIVYQASGGISVMAADGTDRQQLTTDPTDRYPSWSPDGTMIVFVRTGQEPFAAPQGGVPSEVWTMNANGAQQQMVGPGTDPSFSPDGTRIIYALDGAIREMDADDGGNDVPVTNGPNDSVPVYRPNGQHIAFVRGYDTGTGFALDVLVSNPNGENVAPVSVGDSITQFPDWAPDGSALTFFNGEGIWTSPYPNPNPQLIYPNAGDMIIKDPAFSSDGSMITFVRGVQTGGGAAGAAPLGSYDYYIWLMGAAGQDPHQLPNDEPGAESPPNWQPLLGPTPTPTPTGVQQTEKWGDNNCDGNIDLGDVTYTLAYLAGVGETADDCPPMGATRTMINVQPAGAGPAAFFTFKWGNVHCNEEIDGLDPLKLLWHQVGLSGVPGEEDCPNLGDLVTFE